MDTIPPHTQLHPLALPPTQAGAGAPTIKPKRGAFRRRITAGLIIIIPLWFSYWLGTLVLSLLRDGSLWAIKLAFETKWGVALLKRWGVTKELFDSQKLEALPTVLEWALYVLAVLLTVLVIYFLGWFTANVVGKHLLQSFERLVGHLPIVKTVYGASKQLLESFDTEGGTAFQKVVLIPFLGKEMRTVGFVTGESIDRVTGETLYNVFIATTPNPTTGFVFVVHKHDVIELDWTIEEAVKMVMSAGVVQPKPVTLEADVPVEKLPPPKGQ